MKKILFKTIPTNHFYLISRLKHKWIVPEGHDTGIKVYNCITKQKEPLIVKNKNFVTWYTCGPTVYDSAHIGHASCYVKLDIIQKILRNIFNLNLVTVVNITDIDDKIINKSIRMKLDYKDIIKKYEKDFWKDWKSMKIAEPNIVLRVSENIPLIIEFINKLVKLDQTYRAEDGTVLFDVEKYKNYGKLQQMGEIITEKSEYKKSSMDFALWKPAKPGEPFWDSPWGPGRPGWHIECSALASFALGSNIDIHAGAIDLKFPHHENEEAQSCAYHCTHQWVNNWLHVGHLHLRDSEKMSKSLKNTITIEQLLQKTSVDSFRMACAMSHYRSSMEFSFEVMDTASSVLTNFKNFRRTCRDYSKGFYKNVNVDVNKLEQLLNESSKNIYDAFCDDFNTPAIINTLNKIVSTVNPMLCSNSSSENEVNSKNLSYISSLVNLLENTLKIFNVHLSEHTNSSDDFVSDFTDVMEILNNFRQGVRQVGLEEKNQNILKLCDIVRDELKKNGITVKDHGKLSSWSQ